jgi:SAM-dependent methyltransferase
MNFAENLRDVIFAHPQVEDNPFEMPTRDIEIYACPKCTHVQIANMLGNGFYENYLIDSFNDALYSTDNINNSEPGGGGGGGGEFLKARRKKLKSYAKGGDRFLDIGCGTGNILKVARTYFNDCVGVEPSTDGYKIAKDAGLNVINAYFDASLALSGFDVFITTEVFEHLENPVGALADCYSALRPGGVGLINVPDGHRIITDSEYFYCIPEHLNYFTPLSLAALAHATGFEVLEINKIDFADELDVYVRKPGETCLLGDAKGRDSREIAEAVSNCSNIIVWGAGLKSHHYIQLAKNIKISHIIDSSKDKVGKYINSLDIPIEEITPEIIVGSDAVIIFATAYNDNIIKTLREKYQYRGKIIYFDDGVKCI